MVEIDGNDAKALIDAGMVLELAVKAYELIRTKIRAAGITVFVDAVEVARRAEYDVT